MDRRANPDITTESAVKRSNCRACRQPFEVVADNSLGPHPASVRLTFRTLGVSRMSDFELCPRCLDFPESPERAAQVQAMLMAELRALMA